MAADRPNLLIDPDRLWSSLMELGQIGGTEKGGVCRIALTDLDRGGNLKFATDFRAVYATVIQNWLGRNPADILDGQFSPLTFV